MPGSYVTLIEQAAAPGTPAANRVRLYRLTADDVLYYKNDAGTVYVVINNTDAQTVNGIKTFGSIPVLPASDPTTSNQATRKAYVDLFALLTGATFTGATNVSAGGLSDASRRVISKHTSSATDVAVTGTLTETDLISATLAANTLGTTGGLRITSWGTVTGSAGTKRVRAYFGATAIGDTTAVSGTADWFFETVLRNDGATNAQEILVRWASPLNATNHNTDRITAAIDTTAGVTIKCTGTLGNTGDTITQTALLIEAIL